MTDEVAVSRSKTVSWHDPLRLATVAPTLSGLDFLQRIAAGELPPPPIASLLGMTIQRIETGRVVFGCLPDESVYNPIGVVHGGLVCTLLDTVVGCAVHTMLPIGTGYTSIEIKVNYLRPVSAGVDLTAEGWVTMPGRRIAFAEGDSAMRPARSWPRLPQPA